MLPGTEEAGWRRQGDPAPAVKPRANRTVAQRAPTNRRTLQPPHSVNPDKEPPHNDRSPPVYLVTGNEDNPDARKAGQAARNVPDDPERGERIRSRMAELGLREIDVASACDVTISAVQKWKKGTSIRTKNVAALAKVLKWEPRVLLGAHYQHYERRTAGAMRPFEEVAARISELREDLAEIRSAISAIHGKQAEGEPPVTLKALHEEQKRQRQAVEALTRAVRGVQRQRPAQDKDQRGTGDSRREDSGAS